MSILWVIGGCSGAIDQTPPLTLSELARLDLRAEWSPEKDITIQGLPPDRRLTNGAWLVVLSAQSWPGSTQNAPITAWLQGQAASPRAHVPHALSAPLQAQPWPLRPATPDDFNNPLEFRVAQIKDALSETPTVNRGSLALLAAGDSFGILDTQPSQPLHTRLQAVLRVTAVHEASTDLAQTAGSALPLPGDTLVWLGPSPSLALSHVLIAAPEGLDLKPLISDERVMASALSASQSPVTVVRRRVPPGLSPSGVIAQRASQLAEVGLHDAPSADLILWWFHTPSGGLQVAVAGRAATHPLVQALLEPPFTPHRERWSRYMRWFQSLLLTHQHAYPESVFLLQSLCLPPPPSDEGRCAASQTLNALAMGLNYDIFKILKELKDHTPALSPAALWTSAHLFGLLLAWDQALQSVQEAAQSADITPALSGLSWLLHAQILQQSSKIEEALAILRAPPAGIPSDIQRLGNFRASLLEAILRNDTSDATLEALLSEAQSLPPAEAARTLLMFGQADSQNPARAQALLQRAADAFDRAGLPARAAAAYLNLLAAAAASPSEDLSGRAGELAALATEAASRFAKASDHTAAAESFLEAALILLSSPPNPDFNQTLLALLASAQQHFTAAKHFDGVARAWLTSASVLLSHFQDPSAALNALTAASLYAHAAGTPQTIAESEWHLAQLRRSAGHDPATVEAHLIESARFALLCGAPCAELQRRLTQEGFLNPQ